MKNRTFESSIIYTCIVFELSTTVTVQLKCDPFTMFVLNQLPSSNEALHVIELNYIKYSYTVVRTLK